MNISNPDNIFNKLFNKIGDVILLNLLFVIFSIPVVTIGASLTALYHCCIKIMKGDETVVRKDFFKSFKENFKQSTIVWLAFLVIGIILVFNIQFLQGINTPSTLAFRYLSFFIAILVVLEMLYIFPVIAVFKNSTKNLLKNSLIFTYMHFPSTVAIAFIWFFPIFLTLTDLALFPLYIFCWVVFGFSLLALTTSWFFYRIFKKQL